MFDPKTPDEIQAMRDGGKILATILSDLKKRVVVGMTGLEVNDWVAQEIKRHGAIATYQTSEVNFPGVICISLNDQIVHGIPNGDPFQNGDIVSFDLVITYKNMKTDSAFSMVVGDKPNSVVKHLISNTERSLYAGIDAIKGAGTKTGDIGSAIEDILDKAKLGVIRDMVGHGVGHTMHQEPEVPNYGKKGTGYVLQPGDTIAIEPMATLRGEKVVAEDDGWTLSTRDGSLAAHFEHTVLITEDGAEILTQL